MTPPTLDQSAPAPPVAESPVVTVAAVRCPYCHESVDVDEEAWTVCGSCLARHHTACWDEHGSCSSCGSTARLTLGPASPGRLAPLPERAVQPMQLKAAIGEACGLYRNRPFPLILNGLVATLLSSASSGFIGGLTGAGLWSQHLGALRGQGNGKLGDLFAHANRFVPLLLALFTVMILTMVTLPLLVIPGLLVSGGLGYTLPLVAERKLGVKDALKTSWRLARSGGLLKHGLLAFFTILCSLVILIPVGGVFAYAALVPLIYGTWAAAYRQVTGDGSRFGQRTVKDGDDKPLP